MRATLALILALGYAGAIYALLVFLSGPCPTGGIAPLALLWVAFAALELPATLAGPGNRARLFKRAAFALLVAGAALALTLGPSPDCRGGSPISTALLVLLLGAVVSGALLVLTRRKGRQEADLTGLGPGERKSDRIRRGR
jgi:hypothetical protein